ncbi:hypothetical protein C8F01DRAFT_1123936 [Mycena amicta]|nr:hypothetical protein C8F01DRAFT_1123936 [Mycena amicta]
MAEAAGQSSAVFTLGQSEPVPPQKCSVRGCSKIVEPPPEHTARRPRMCASCREKHRNYADSKRARRKAEKALIVGLADGTVLAAPEGSATAPSNPHHPKTLLEQYPELLASLTLAERAKQKRRPTTSFTHEPSSGVAGPSTTPNWAIDPVLYNQPSTSSALAGALGQQLNLLPPVAPDQDPAAVATVNGKPRYCSVKGCKAIIPDSVEDYPFRMCRSCRDRYRIYGITKRKKSKTARADHDKQLEALLTKEDERRAGEGLPPLSESPEDLYAYEQSLVDAQSALPPPHQARAHGKPAVPMPPVDPRFLRPTADPSRPPLRVCSVSHCHKILVGSYRFKRCDAHRQQNRWHSLIKRGREKVQKGILAEDGTVLIEPGPIRLGKEDKGKGKAEVTESQTPTEQKDINLEEVSFEGNLDNVVAPQRQHRSNRNTKDRAICKQDDCCNFIPPGTRWRTCTSCKAKWVGPAQAAKQSVPRTTNDAATSESSTSTSEPAPTSAFQEHSEFSSSSLAPVVVPLGYTSTSTLMVVDEPPPEGRSKALQPSGRRTSTVARDNWRVQTPESVALAASSVSNNPPMTTSSATTLPYPYWANVQSSGVPNPYYGYLPHHGSMILVPVSAPAVSPYPPNDSRLSTPPPHPVQYYALTPAPPRYPPQETYPYAQNISISNSPPGTSTATSATPPSAPVQQPTSQHMVFMPQTHPQPPVLASRPYSRTADYVHYEFENGQVGVLHLQHADPHQHLCSVAR